MPALGDKFCSSVNKGLALIGQGDGKHSAKQRSHLFAALLYVGIFLFN